MKQGIVRIKGVLARVIASSGNPIVEGLSGARRPTTSLAMLTE